MHIRIFGLRYRFYYRMDTSQPLISGVYHWPTDLLLSNRLQTSELGLTATMQTLVQNKMQEVYVPLSTSSSEGGSQSTVRVAMALPSRSTKMYLTVARVGAEGRLETPLLNGRPDPRSYYPDNQPSTLQLPPMPQPGIYSIQIGADLADGGSVSTAFWLYRADSPKAEASPGPQARPDSKAPMARGAKE